MHPWRKVKLGDLLLRSKIPIDIEDKKTYSRVTIRTKHQGVSKRDDEVGKKIGTKKQFLLKSGQFVMSKIDARYGAFGIADQYVHDAIITGNFWAYDINQELTTVEWIERYTNSSSFYDLCERASSGITHRKYLDEKVFLAHELNIPSKEDQSNILLKLEKEQKSLNELATENKNQSSYLAKLRQAILQEAIEGKLTADWRKENPVRKGDPDYDAEALLVKIQAEKEKLIKQGKIKKQKPLAPIKAEEVPFELPVGWVWTRLGEICSKITDGFHNTPPKKTTGVPYIAATHVNEDFIDWANCHYVDEIYHRELYYKAFPQIGELLVVNIGAGCGIAAIIDVDYEFSFKNTAILKFNQDYILNKYLLFYFILNRPDIYSDLTKGGLQPFLSLSILNHILIPLPPFTEQQAIVERVEKLLSMVDELEKQVSERKEQSEQLMQAVLREAFEGKA